MKMKYALTAGALLVAMGAANIGTAAAADPTRA